MSGDNDKVNTVLVSIIDQLVKDIAKKDPYFHQDPFVLQLLGFFSQVGGGYPNTVFFQMFAFLRADSGLGTAVHVERWNDSEQCYRGHVAPGGNRFDVWQYTLCQLRTIEWGHYMLIHLLSLSPTWWVPYLLHFYLNIS